LIFCNNWCFRVGIEFPTIEVRYENLNIEAEAYVGSSALPSFAKFIFNIIEVTAFPINEHQLLMLKYEL
jgi:hypothetical protein